MGRTTAPGGTTVASDSGTIPISTPAAASSFAEAPETLSWMESGAHVGKIAIRF